MTELTRRNFLRICELSVVGGVLAACGAGAGENSPATLSGFQKENGVGRRLGRDELNNYYAAALAGISGLSSSDLALTHSQLLENGWRVIRNGDKHKRAVYFDEASGVFLKTGAFNDRALKIEAEQMTFQVSEVFGEKAEGWIRFHQVGNQQQGFAAVESKALGVNLRQALKEGLVSEKDLPQIVMEVAERVDELLEKTQRFNNDLNPGNIILAVDPQTGELMPQGNRVIIIDWQNSRFAPRGVNTDTDIQTSAYRKLIKEMERPEVFASILEEAKVRGKSGLVDILKKIAERNGRTYALADRMSAIKVEEKEVRLPVTTEVGTNVTSEASSRLVSVVTSDGKYWIVSVDRDTKITEEVLRKAGVAFPAKVMNPRLLEILKMGGKVIKVGSTVVAVALTAWELYELAGLGKTIEIGGSNYCTVGPDCFPNGLPEEETIKDLVNSGLERSPAMYTFQQSIENIYDRHSLSLGQKSALRVLDDPSTIGVLGTLERSYFTGVTLVFDDENKKISYVHPESNTIINVQEIEGRWKVGEIIANGEEVEDSTLPNIEYSLVLRGRGGKAYEVIMRMQLVEGENGELIEQHVPVYIFGINSD